ncbi:2-oxoglutarate dehydrogenase, E2 component, dihydrolipoamide succinyltransferase [Segniliparus rotundus DSM 44985]|uniref:Dihydrolipoamide acetyltransferase component of pyruvate dehydrogenase complex n=1 Tax=Segniliparus rotundus (strain ATCC BAA-972 / CDC 1076 / CIP 108378 / DSM 44985 / JCM 13578) TaxID=640132 RepID=D6Z9C2_SEGRD|nr:2-oxoglutarate dehydrogenase, E2 component, dihydrolipoamide succinyltransferase [Segniliparus rotundus]ADG98552.1 2-oxoglutarate dehydrogenase, E2 component, dihydrolipoamide succinyltransferase [Segniliparus rotundus DSM 44985]
MAISVRMPALGESVTEGTVTRWLKNEGDTVATDEPLLEVSTDKVDTEIPSPGAGVLQKIVAPEDAVVEVGGELAVISEDGESAPSASEAEPAQQEEAPEPQEPASEEATPQEPKADDAPAAQSAPASDASGTTVTMPTLGESVTEGTVTRWLKQEGDTVEVDEPLLEISTDKVDTEIPSPAAGVLQKIIAAEDAVVEVGGDLAVIGSGSAPAAAQETKSPEPENAPAPKTEEPQEQEKPAPAAPTQEAPAPVEEKPAPAKEEPARAAEAAQDEADGANPYVTPLVRKLAREHGVDLATITGSGIGGRIRKQDVLDAAESKKAPPEPAQKTPAAPSSPEASSALAHLRGTTQKVNRVRQITAKKTRESLLSTAQLTQTFEVDMTKIAALRGKAKAGFQEREKVNLTFLPFFAKAVVEALKAHPNVNASFDEEAKEITYHDAEHLGIAVDTEQGLLSPVIHNAGDLSLAGLARAIADIAARARSGNLKPDELSGGTFTITNIGSQGALFDTPILVPPQAAMLGTGAIVRRPVVVKDDTGEEVIAIRSMVFLPLTYDHRLIDGADAGRFLTTVKHRLEEGAFEADLGL